VSHCNTNDDEEELMGGVFAVIHRASRLHTFSVALIASIVASTGADAQVVLSGTAGASTPDDMRRFTETAATLIRSAHLEPGDKVVITGGPAGLAFMQELAIAAERLGAHTWLLITPERLARFRSLEKPAEFLGTPPTALDSAIANMADLRILISNPEQTLAYQAMSTERLQLASRSNGAWATIDSATRRRILFIALPQPSDTIGTGVTFDAYSRMIWNAIGADYDGIAAQGLALARRLERARRVHVTSPEGTDLTLAVGDLPVVVQAGLPATGGGATLADRSAALPRGHVFVATDSTAQGRIRAAADMCGLRGKVRDESIDIHGSMPENVHAATFGACVQRAVASHRLSGLSIGLNPALEARETPGGLLANSSAAGVVGLMFGGNNWFGGPNPDASVWLVPLLRATVEVDGHVLVHDGKIVERP
jgi:leucyl aminopeptidase (aminopeptidase T)